MRKSVAAGLAAAIGLGSTCAVAQQVTATISGEIKPGVYGRVVIGNTPPPLLYPQPVIIVRENHPAPPQPLYLHVPPGHAKHWDKHCHQYNACNRPVYFVKSAEYEPGYNKHNKGKGKG